MRKFAAFLLILILAGCATRMPEITPIGCPTMGPSLEGQWYNSGHAYQMRHEGVLSFGSTTLPLTGLMRLDTARQTARVAILTGMGIKLLVLDMTADGHTVLATSPAAEKIPGFKEGAPAAIRAVFLNPFPGGASYCASVDNTLNYVEESPDGPVLFRVDERGETRSKAAGSWRVTYGADALFDGLRMPGEVEYSDPAGRFTVTLKLISAKRI